MFISFDTFINAMDFSSEEVKKWGNILSHVVWGLNKEDLITGFSYGSVDHIKKKFKEVTSPGIIYQPTKMGVELFMWAYGYGQENTNDFFKHSFQFPNEQNVKIGKGISTKKIIENP